MGYDRFIYAMFKDEILESRKVNLTCHYCGSTVRRRNIKRHQRTIKCETKREELKKDINNN